MSSTKSEQHQTHEKLAKEITKPIEFLFLPGETVEIVTSRQFSAKLGVLSMCLLVILFMGILIASIATPILVSHWVVLLAVYDVIIACLILFVWGVGNKYIGTDYSIVTNLRAIRVFNRRFIFNRLEIIYLPLALVRDLSLEESCIRLWPHYEPRNIELEFFGWDEDTLNATRDQIADLCLQSRAAISSRRKSLPKDEATVSLQSNSTISASHRQELDKTMVKLGIASERWSGQDSRARLLLRSMTLPLLALFLFPLFIVPFNFLLMEDVRSSLIGSAVATGAIYITWSLFAAIAHRVVSPTSTAISQKAIVQTESASFLCCTHPASSSKLLSRSFPVVMEWNRTLGSGSFYFASIDEYSMTFTDQELEIIDKYNTQADEYTTNAHVSIEVSHISGFDNAYNILWQAFEDEVFSPSTAGSKVNGKSFASLSGEIEV